MGLRSRRPRRTWIALPLLAGVWGCGPSGESARSTDPAPDSHAESGEPEADPVVAKVGPLEIRLETLLELTRKKEESARPVRPGETVTDVRKRIRVRELNRMIERRLLVYEALKHPDWISEASVQAEVHKQLRNLGADEVERRRKLAGVSEEDFRSEFEKFVREELSNNAVLEREVRSQATVTEAEIRARFEEAKESKYRRPDGWAVRRVEKYLPRTRADELPELLEKMKALREEVADAIESADSPESMAERTIPFVREHGETEEAGGGYAFVYDHPEVDFDPEFLSRLRTSTLGELSPVFELAGNEERVGACFFLPFQEKPGVYSRFEDVRIYIERDLANEKARDLRTALFERLREEFPVDTDLDNLLLGLEEPVQEGENR